MTTTDSDAVTISQADLADIQGGILQAYGNSYLRTSYLFLEIVDASAARTWLRGLVQGVTTAERWPDNVKPATHLNVAFTANGLSAIGVGADELKTFSSEFQQGMASRAERLGDVGQHAPSAWEAGLGNGSAHVLLILNALAEDQLQARLSQLLPEGGAHAGVRIVHEDHAALIEPKDDKNVRPREHFGFADGLAQPAIEGTTEHKTRGGGTPEADDKWRALAIGEFVLGFDDEATRPYPKEPPPSAPAAPLGKHGTYIAWRKLKQDVALFRRTLRDSAVLYGGNEELLAAKVVGRWRSGAALQLSPDSPDGGFVDGVPDNDFRYSADPDGKVCPLGAHIRRSNPRDALGYEGTLTFRHRMLRRGTPYGDPLAEAATEDDGHERGLIFVCYVASISRQFEGVQTQWMEDGNIFGLGHDKDFLQRGAGDGHGKMTVQGEPPFLLAPQPDFVTMRGGEYLFAPGIAALRALADGG